MDFELKSTGNMTVEPKEKHPAWPWFERWLARFPNIQDNWVLYWSAFCEGWKAREKV